LKAHDLIRDHAKLSDAELKRAIAKLDRHEKDLLVPCKVCGANEGEECVDVSKRVCARCSQVFGRCECHAGPYVMHRKKLISLDATKRAEIVKPGIVHIGRRITRLLKGIR